MDQKLAIRIIMDCKTTSAHKFRAKLGKLISVDKSNKFNWRRKHANTT